MLAPRAVHALSQIARQCLECSQGGNPGSLGTKSARAQADRAITQPHGEVTFVVIEPAFRADRQRQWTGKRCGARQSLR